MFACLCVSVCHYSSTLGDCVIILLLWLPSCPASHYQSVICYILSHFTLPINDFLYLVPHLKDVPLAEFMYFVFTCMPGVVTIGNSDLCCRVPCLSNALISLC